jgi:hypothetical protein
MARKEPDPAVASEPLVKVEMDIAEADDGGSALIQIRVRSSAADACSKVTRAIELAVRTACEEADQPSYRVN